MEEILMTIWNAPADQIVRWLAIAVLAYVGIPLVIAGAIYFWITRGN